MEAPEPACVRTPFLSENRLLANCKFQIIAIASCIQSQSHLCVQRGAKEETGPVDVRRKLLNGPHGLVQVSVSVSCALVCPEKPRGYFLGVVRVVR